ncbi:phosphoesterase PA-phosphatase related protein, partial [mine drainage metagenome]
MLDPQHRELPGLVLLGALLVASLWLFFGVLQDVLAGAALVRTNEAVFHFMQSLRTDWIDQIMVAVSELGDATVVTATAIAAMLWFAWRSNWRAAAHALAAVVAASLFTLVFNLALHIPQPGAPSEVWNVFSFPSGHSVASAALYGFLTIVSVWE